MSVKSTYGAGDGFVHGTKMADRSGNLSARSWLQYCSNTSLTLCCTKNRHCESFRVTSPLAAEFVSEQTIIIIESFAKSKSIYYVEVADCRPM